MLVAAVLISAITVVVATVVAVSVARWAAGGLSAPSAQPIDAPIGGAVVEVG